MDVSDLVRQYPAVIDYLYNTNIEEEKESLSESLKYGFPSMKALNSDGLRKELEDEPYKI